MQEPGDSKTSETTLTMNVAEFAKLIRSGEITMQAADTDLQVPALADLHNEECYPDTTIEIKRGDDVIARVWCWMLGWYEKGPNRRDNGAYIGNGWQWLTDDSDGQSTGRPRENNRRDGTVSWGADTSSLVLPYDDDVSEDDIDTISQALSDAYNEISVSPADDDDVYAEMVKQRSDAELSVEINGDDVTLDLYANLDAGRTVYTYEGAEEVWDDASECVEAARKHLRKLLSDAADSIGDDDDLAATLIASLDN